MSKISGITTTVAIDESGGTARNISNDITDLTMATPRGVQEVTGLDKSAIERLLLLTDQQVTVNGIFNPTAQKSHDVFKTVGSTSVARTVAITFDVSDGNRVLDNELFFTDYQITRAATGELTWTSPGMLADGTFTAWA
jgi:hypothetical protein